jgi:putative hemolysin
VTGSVLLELVAILILVLANGFFALAEFSIIASRSSRLRRKVQHGKPGAAAAEKLHRKPEEFLATVQVGITLFSTLAGVFGGATIVNHLQQVLSQSSLTYLNQWATPISVVCVTVGITVTAVVFGELVPKYLALSYPERYARYSARPISIFIWATSFFSRILSSSASLVVRLFGARPDPNRSTVTEEEINLMIFEGRQKGVFDETEERLIKSVFDFADSTVRRAMTPRTEVVGIEKQATPDEIIAVVIKHGHTRYPVFDGTIDNIVGVIYTKDLVLQKLNPQLIHLNDMLRQPSFVPDSMPASRLLQDFQRKKYRLAIVLDEFGGTAGIVTLQDVLEELVGEIQDEDDDGAPELVKHSDNIAFADGSVWPGAINDLMDSHLPEEQSDTLAGLVYDELGRLPKERETLTIADMKITVVEKDATRLARLKLERTKDDSTDPMKERDNDPDA